MPRWAEFATEEPELARQVEDRFAVRKHKTLATLRKDGSPRISGIETEFADGELRLGMMPDSRKLIDLRRDPRMAVHSPTEDPPADRPSGWRGEAKIAGRAIEVPGENRVRIDVEEVVLTHLNQAGDKLVVDAWHVGRGRSQIER
jgi:Pyridoxamine 5'-phosphate oxidase